MQSLPVDLLAHDEWLRPLVRSLVAEHEVDDVLQDTWLAAVRHRPKPGSLRAWLAKVARNSAVTVHRRNVRRQRRERATPPPAHEPSTAETVEKLALQAQVARAVAELDEPYREAVILRYHDGLTHAEVAEVQGISADNARQRVKRGLDQLRRRMTRESGSDWRAGAAVLALVREPQVSGPALLSNVSLGVWMMSHGLRVAAALLVVAVAFVSIRVWTDAPPEIGARPVAEPTAMQAEAPPVPELGPAEPVRRRVAVAAPETEVVPEPVLSVRGHVVDTLGRPVAGVRIAGVTASDAAFAAWNGVPGELPGAFRLLATSDAAGAFAVDLAERVGDIRVESPFVMLHRPANLRGDGGEDLLMVVADEARIAGVVSDERGVPLEDVDIDVQVARVASVPVSLENTDRVRFEGMETGADGRFDLAGLPGTHARVTFAKPGYRAVQRELRPGAQLGESVVLELREEGRYLLHGRVADATGRPLAHARVGAGEIETRADEFGAYRLELDDEVLEGADVLYAASPGARTFVHRSPNHLFDRAAEVELNITLEEPLQLAGHIRDERGAPVEGVHVRLWMEPELCEDDTGADLSLEGIAPRREEEVAAPRVYAVSGRDGSFELSGLEAKYYQLRFRHPASWVAWTEGPLLAGQTDLQVRAPMSAVVPEVRGRVVDGQGLAVPGVTVEFSVQVHRSPTTNSWSGPESQVADAEGRFRFVDVPAADQVLVVVSGDDILVKMQVFEPDDLYAELALPVESLCEFRVDSLAECPTRFALRDVSDEEVQIWERRGKTRTAHGTFSLTEGRSPILTASERTHFVVFLDDDRNELYRALVRLVPGELTRVQR